jgi:rRNA biogenesis protein RRP5
LALAEGKLVPQSADDFERLIVANPNASFLWIQYMAFYVGSTDIDSARMIANRALRTINFREEEVSCN